MCSRILFTLAAVAVSAAAGAQALGFSGGAPGMEGRTTLSTGYDHTPSAAVDDNVGVRLSHAFHRTGKLSLSANADYAFMSCHFSPADMPSGYDPTALGMNGTHHFLRTGISLMVRTRAFGRPMMAFGNVAAEWGDGGFGKLSAMGLALVMIRADRRVQFGVGPLVMLNTTSRIPAFPVFIYRNRLSDRLALNLFGTMLGLDYTVSPADMLTVGGDISVRSFYFSPQTPSLPEKCRFTNTSFRPCVRYRRTFAPGLYGELQAGVSLKMSCRVNGVNSSKECFDIAQKPAPFVHAAVVCSLK